MNNFRDFSALHNVLGIAYKECAQEWRRAVFADKLQEVLGFTKQQAQLYASTVLSQNAEGSADWVTTNGSRVSGSWVRGEQQGNVGGWLSTMKETWQFEDDLTYTHKIEKYESSISTGPFFQSSYSRPTMSEERGIWAPPDTTLDQLELFVMSSNGFARRMTLEWIEKEKYDYGACSIDRKRFSRE
jgi:hypothetical protein